MRKCWLLRLFCVASSCVFLFDSANLLLLLFCQVLLFAFFFKVSGPHSSLPVFDSAFQSVSGRNCCRRFVSFLLAHLGFLSRFSFGSTCVEWFLCVRIFSAVCSTCHSSAIIFVSSPIDAFNLLSFQFLSLFTNFLVFSSIQFSTPIFLLFQANLFFYGPLHCNQTRSAYSGGALDLLAPSRPNRVTATGWQNQKPEKIRMGRLMYRFKAHLSAIRTIFSKEGREKQVGSRSGFIGSFLPLGTRGSTPSPTKESPIGFTVWYKFDRLTLKFFYMHV